MSEIKLKSEKDIKIMEENGKILADILNGVCDRVRSGITTYSLDLYAKGLFLKNKAFSACLNYEGFPAHICVSINEEIVHGIPSQEKFINEGDIVSIDVSLVKDGYFVDSARTIAVGKVDEKSQKLLEVTKNALIKGIDFLLPNKHLGDYTKFVQSYVNSNKMFVFEETGGHGIGEDFHENPFVPNCGRINNSLKLKEGMTLAVEPMVNLGTNKIRILQDGWTIITDDGSRSAHFEHTVAITKDGPKILTK